MRRILAIVTVTGRLLLAGLLLIALPALAKEPPALQGVPDLGRLSFPTSTTSAPAQTAFIRGALLLHLFEYDDAAKAFKQAQQLDPGFAMAYWGEAMTYNHGIWNQLDEAAGRAALAKLAATPAARAAKAPTPRERGFLAAVEILYDGQGDKVQRDQRYVEAMKQLTRDFPGDDEATLFYSLALLGRSEGVRDVPTYLEAAKIAETVYRRNPDHPGASHYWIHGMDDPEHAAGALEAAQGLARVAPGAGHAQHMASHIFMALGMWDEVTGANTHAMHVVDAQRVASGKLAVSCFHYDEWKQYAYFQQGRIAEGLALLQSCATTGRDQLGRLQGKDEATFRTRWTGSLVTMRAQAVIGAADWNGPAAKLVVAVPANASVAAWDHFTTGYAAAERGDLAVATAAQDALSALVAAAKPAPDDHQWLDYLHVLDDELTGLVASKRGDGALALTRVRAAAERYGRLAFDFGPPVTIKPPQELLGELLLAGNDPQGAAVAFTTALVTAPRRAQSVLGLARAQAASGDAAAARTTYGQLLAIWHAADLDLPALAEARAFVAAGKR